MGEINQAIIEKITGEINARRRLVDDIKKGEKIIRGKDVDLKDKADEYETLLIDTNIAYQRLDTKTLSIFKFE